MKRTQIFALYCATQTHLGSYGILLINITLAHKIFKLFLVACTQKSFKCTSTEEIKLSVAKVR